MEDPGGAEDFEHGGWSFEFDRGSDGDRFKLDELMAADAQLLGRVTYQGFARAWPSMEGNPFAEKMNEMPKYVVSSTLSDAEADWKNSTVIRGDLGAEVSSLKDSVPGDVLVAGSGQLARGLAEHDLIDEYRLMVFPVLLGTGKRLFAEGVPRRRLRLTGAAQVGTDGVMTFTYEPQLQAPGGDDRAAA
jgi:dihydrofolate reductase